MTSPAGPWLKRSSDTTRAGRRPACAWPLTGLKSVSHTSPRLGATISASATTSPAARAGLGRPCLDRLSRQSVQQGTIPGSPLFRHPRPRGGILAQGGIAGVDPPEESLPPGGFERRRED